MDIDLDKVLYNIGGLGSYQKNRYVVFCIIIIFATFPTLSYILTTHNVPYRCFIDECEESPPNFTSKWVANAVPFIQNEPSECLRYKKLSNTGSACTSDMFNKTDLVKCSNVVYSNDMGRTIVNDFNLICDNNLWKLTIVGTINNIGFLAGLPVAGYISDRFGRKTLMLWSIVASTIFGLIKSFSPSYLFFVIGEFFDMWLGSGLYTATYILGMELLIAKYRVLGSTIMSCAFAFGEAIMGFVAWYTPSWRIFLRILYAPGFLLLTSYWFTDESVRWLISREKIHRAKRILGKIAKENGCNLDEPTTKQLNISNDDKPCIQTADTFIDVFQSPILFLRLINCSFAWICCTFVYYGLTMHSVGISGNMYINYIAVSLIEIPAYVIANFALNLIGRKWTLSFSFLLSGSACIAFIFLPDYCKLTLFLLGKFSVTIAYATIYLYTTEMFPTSLRHSFMSTCSMFGRIGSMIAPQIPILAKISKSLPMLLFSGMAITSGVLSLLFPETLNAKLPDTMQDAIHIGKTNNNEENESKWT